MQFPNSCCRDGDSRYLGVRERWQELQSAASCSRPQALWDTAFNPAGLTLATQTSVSGSARVYQFASVSPESMPGKGGSLHHVASLVGLVVPNAADGAKK